MKKNTVVIAAAVAVLFVAGGLFASNMGFKLNYTLDNTGTNGSNSGTNTLGLPYNQQTNLSDASDLRDDINATVANSVVSISRFLRDSDALQTYTGSSAATNFALGAGEGYRVVVSSPVNYIVVGSHDPGLVINLDAAGTNGSNSGTNDFSIPYHTTATDASDLRDEINAAAGSSTAVVSISRFLRDSDALQTYTGSSAATNFSITPGISVRVVVGTDVAYVPSHY